MKKNTLLTLLFVTLLPLVSLPLIGAAVPGMPFSPGQGQMPPMSEEDLLRWQEEVDAEIAKFVNTLPPEEQEKFHKDVEELTKVMENMSEDELTAFVESMFPAQEGAMPPVIPQTEEPVVVPSPTKPETTPIKEEKPSAADVASAQNTEKALKLLNNLITRIERFLRKANLIPELSGRISQWVAKDKIKEWQADLTWDKLKKDINALDQKLHTIKESMDPKTRKHRYINDFLKNESLFNNLTRLSTTLTSFEPKVEAPATGVGHVHKASRDAIREVLGALTEALYTLDVSAEMDKITASYEPRAKTLREEEEGFAKQALEESKRPRKEGFKREVGTGRSRYEVPASVTSGPDYYGGGRGFTPSYDAIPGYPGAGYDDRFPTPGKTDFPGAGGAAGGAMPHDMSSAKDGKGFGKDADRKAAAGLGEKGEEGKQDKERGPEKPKEEKPEENKAITKKIKKIEGHLKAVEAKLDTEDFAALAKDILNPATPVKESLVNDIFQATDELKKATRATQNFGGDIKFLPANEKKMYGKKIKDMMDEYKEVLEKAAQNASAMKKKINEVSPAKQFAYFGNVAVQEQVVKDNPALAELRPANLNELLKELNGFDVEITKYLPAQEAR
jgi:hypothetical protein